MDKMNLTPVELNNQLKNIDPQKLLDSVPGLFTMIFNKLQYIKQRTYDKRATKAYKKK